MKNYEALFSPICIGGVKVKNRIIMSAMETNYAGYDGTVNEKWQAYITERARGGVGMIITEATSVSYPQGRIGACQLRINDPLVTARWADAIAAVHSFDARILMQLHHGGIQAVPAYGDGSANLCPSDFDFHGAMSGRAMTLDEIHKVRDDFIYGAKLAREAGVDGVEIHAAHMYLLHNFLSPLTNRRTDEYGGTPENRGRLLREIVEGIRAACPRPFIISVRLAGQDFLPIPCMTLEDGKYFAAMCEKAGADMINVSSGFVADGGDIQETQFEPEGHRLFLGEAMKSAVSIPVSTVGKMRTPAFCNEAVASGKTDLITMGRQLLCDPAWPKKALLGRPEEIRPCLSCNVACISGYSKSNTQCVLNPFTSHESQTRESSIPLSGSPRRITVIGGGVAGMEFAIIAKRRGHSVHIVEKSDRLGGQMNLACLPPHKDQIAEARDWFTGEVQRLGIPVDMNHTYTAEEAGRDDSDCFVIAAGAVQSVPPIDGIEKAVPTWDVLTGKHEVLPGTHVAIIGGGSVSCETAELLIQKGCKVSIIELTPEILAGYERIHKGKLMYILKTSADLHVCAGTLRIGEKELVISENGEEKTLHPDLVIYSTGNRSCTELYDQLLDMGKEAYLIGDACRVGDIRSCTRSAYELAFSV